MRQIRTDRTSRPGYEFTSQLYFDDALTDRVHALPPHAGKGQRTLNSAQRIAVRMVAEAKTAKRNQ